MFISEEEADARRDSASNLLRRLNIPLTKPSPSAQPQPVDEVSEALEETTNDPTEPTADDAVRLAILAGRRHLKTSEERGGRYPQQGNVPPIFRALIGSAAKLGTSTEAARAWGVNSTMAHHYKHGRTSQDKESPGLIEAIDHNTNVIRSQVLDILSVTVAGITPEKLENKDAKELSMIAKNLASIMSATKPIVVAEQTSNAQVIVFTPNQEKETDYPVIEIG
jgi:hypothetical protein